MHRRIPRDATKVPPVAQPEDVVGDLKKADGLAVADEDALQE